MTLLHRLLAAVVKSVKPIYLIYFYLLSTVLKITGKFIKPQKIILFNSYGGKNFDDSPRALFKAMVNDKRFSDWKFVWAFHQPDKFDVPQAEKIKTDSVKYFLTALRARIWITNSAIERGLSFKPVHTFYINTWHGSAIKKMGNDIAADNKSFRSQAKMNADIMNAQNMEQAKIFSRVFNIPLDKFIVCGYPRNDKLCSVNKSDYINIRKKLNIPMDKKVILYAPTFREFERDGAGCVLKPPIDLKKWQQELADKYILLFRAHYEVAKVMAIDDNRFVYNMTAYPDLNELMIASDMLISDYSSIFFDYSLLHKPMLHFCYDYDKYAKLRGMYFDIRDYLNGSDNEDELIKILQNFNLESEKRQLKNFSDKFNLQDGNAAMITVNKLAENIGLDLGAKK